MNFLPIEITDTALKEVKDILENKNIPKDYGLRVGVRGGGCGGMGFVLGFDKKKAGDNEFEMSGVKVYIEKKHTMYLMGLTVDFYEGADARGFTFINKEAEAQKVHENK